MLTYVSIYRYLFTAAGHALLLREGGHGGDAHEPRDHLPSTGTDILPSSSQNIKEHLDNVNRTFQ
jgi:hypothetical protein